MLIRALRGRRNSPKGQVIPIAALMLLVLFGFAGLAVDAGHVFLVQRNVQNATDAAALAAGKRLAGAQQTSAPAVGASTTDASLKSAHDLAAANGFNTVLNASCDSTNINTPQPGLTQFTTSWYDNGGPCGATTFGTRITIYDPPQSLTDNCTVAPYNCIQVVATQQVQNYLMGVLGRPTTTVTASASVYAEPPKVNIKLPAPYALHLYQPGSKQAVGTCPLGQQCFDESLAPSRAQLSCAGVAANCPTFWVQPGSSPLILGVDGNLLPTPADTTALQASGDTVLQDSTTICDPNGGTACAAGTVTGLKGLALASAAKLYCSGFGPGSTSSTSPPCTSSAVQAPLATVYANETSFSPATWAPAIDTSGLNYCAGLVLNGDTVSNSFVGGAAPGCNPPATAPYTILPGQYDWIVINHGQYEFESGLFLITGKAPQNTQVSGFANGIDHSGETAADWDLCGVTPCSATAGIWIGHGTLGFVTPPPPPSPGFCADTSPSFGQTGGGDITQVTASGTTFVFQGPGSSGFVSTHEVDFITMVGPALGQMTQAAGAPLLFFLNNDGFIHLDAAGSNPNSRFRGLIFQYAGAKAGGVEVNPGLAGTSAAAIGQVWAYSFTTFGSSGIALDFSKGFGEATTPPIGVGGRAEPSILTGVSLTAATGRPGFLSLTMNYIDEWKLDGFTAYVRVNNGPPVFFSQGIWNPPLLVGQAPPPTNNDPGDRFPAYPTAAQNAAAGNQYTINTGSAKPDWTMTYADTSTFQIVGDWVWGHERNITGATRATNTANLVYTFAQPAGKQVTVTMFMQDGDRCGDYVVATETLPVPPAVIQQTVGTVRLEQ